jgi:hypothetical protein
VADSLLADQDDDDVAVFSCWPDLCDSCDSFLEPLPSWRTAALDLDLLSWLKDVTACIKFIYSKTNFMSRDKIRNNPIIVARRHATSGDILRQEIHVSFKWPLMHQYI